MCGGDGLIVHGDGFAGFRVHDRGGEPVGFACGEAGVGHFVRDPHVTGHDGVVSVGGVVGVGGDGNGGLGLVVEGAVVVHHAVAGDGDGGVDKPVAFVGGAAQLLDAVGVVGERAVPVVRAGQGALTGEAEPDACGGIEQNTVDGFGFAKRPVVAVGVLRVMVPRGRGVEIPVGVGDDDVGFPGGQAGELEGDSGHPVGAVPGFLAEGEIAAHHLFRHLRRLVGDSVLHGLFLNLLEAQEVAVEHVAFRRFGFVHDEGAARDHGLSAGVPVQVIPGHQMGFIEEGEPVRVRGDDPCAGRGDSGFIEGGVIIIAEGVVVFDGELRAFERGGTLWQVAFIVAGSLAVVFGDHQPGGIVGRGVGERDGRGLLRGDGNALLRCGQKPFRGLGLTDGDGLPCGHLQRARGTVLPCGEGAQHTAVLTVDGELSARQRVQGIPVREGRIGAQFDDPHVSVGHVGEVAHALRVALAVQVEVGALLRADILSGVGEVPALHDDVIAGAVPCAGERVVPGQGDVAPVVDALPVIGLPVRHGHEEGGVWLRTAGVGPEVVHLDMAGARDGGFRRVCLHGGREHAENAAQHEQERHEARPETADSFSEMVHDGLLSFFTSL